MNPPPSAALARIEARQETQTEMLRTMRARLDALLPTVSPFINGDKALAAFLSVSVPTMRAKMRELGIHPTRTLGTRGRGGIKLWPREQILTALRADPASFATNNPRGRRRNPAKTNHKSQTTNN